MNLYLIKVNVVKRMFGISGPIQSTVSKLVHAVDVATAKQKIENYVKQFTVPQQMDCESITFNYVEIIDELK